MPRFNIDCYLSYDIRQDSELIFQIETASHPWQILESESISIDPNLPFQDFHYDDRSNRLIRLSAKQGPLDIRYQATVSTAIPVRNPHLHECRIQDIPSHILHYLSPSRFCESDLITPMVNRTFSTLPSGYQRVQSICDWINQNILYESGSSDNTTTAKDILVNRAGVCRDFAHLGIAMCRALNIPARFVFGYMPFYKALPDFHALFEVYLGGEWVLFDATRLGPIDQFVRIGTGMDAKNVPFATFYGEIELKTIQPCITKID